MERKNKGVWGERLARWLLWAKGYHVIARNFRCKLGEMDLIARKNETLVFIEVRMRGPGSFLLPQETITRKKKERMRKIALWFMAKYKIRDVNCRFDVICIYSTGHFDKPEIMHIEGAF